MNRTIKLTLILLFMNLLSLSLFAQEAENTVEKSQIADGVTLEHSKVKDMMGSVDKLFIDVDGKNTEIFNSEGRTIKQVMPVDGDSDGKMEYVVSMDCGGSGGYYDVVMLKAKEGVWTTVWEDSFAQPKMTLDKDNNILFIEYYEIENDKPVKKLTKLDLSTNTLVKK
ncbi:MAG: hypothetical protein IKO19_07045 [Candidatus Riflebacteria bacterium]|nr:hypothetical protein [Candidatus Riflebacteria bacterium]MBR4570404.1 hypothetical protein [Candidatus Riflebacteria bacterium]